MKKAARKCMATGVGILLFLVVCPLRLAQSVCERVFFKKNPVPAGIDEVFAEVLCSVEEALKILLPEAQDIKEEKKTLTEEQKKAVEKKGDIKLDPKRDGEIHVYIGQVQGQAVGYVFKDTVKGKWGDIHYMLAIDPEGKVKDTVVLEFKERRGRPVKERRFLDQFVGKTAQDPIKLKKDIKGVAGATISSQGMSGGIRKLVHVFGELYKK